LEKIQYVKLLFPYVLAKNKEVDVTSDFVEQPIFEVNVIDTKEAKDRFDRVEEFAKKNNLDF
jgi:hypothetical protein